MASIFTQKLDLDLPLAQVGVALVSSKEAHRVLILDTLGTIHDVDHLALGTNSVTGTNVLDNLFELARHGVPITPLQFESCSTPSDLLPSVARFHNVHSIWLSVQLETLFCSEGSVCSNSK